VLAMRIHGQDGRATVPVMRNHGQDGRATMLAMWIHGQDGRATMLAARVAAALDYYAFGLPP
jgi:hypothetical protein